MQAFVVEGKNSFNSRQSRNGICTGTVCFMLTLVPRDTDRIRTLLTDRFFTDTGTGTVVRTDTS
jgi:hypothetical protein